MKQLCMIISYSSESDPRYSSFDRETDLSSKLFAKSRAPTKMRKTTTSKEKITMKTLIFQTLKVKGPPSDLTQFQLNTRGHLYGRIRYDTYVADHRSAQGCACRTCWCHRHPHQYHHHRVHADSQSTERLCWAHPAPHNAGST